MKHLLIIITILVPLCLFSCKSKKIVETEKISNEDELMYAEMSKDMCKCMEPILKIGEEGTEGKTVEEISDLALKMQEESYKMEDCVEEIKLKYPTIDFVSSNNPKAEKAMIENCPIYKRAIEKKKD